MSTARRVSMRVLLRNVMGEPDIGPIARTYWDVYPPGIASLDASTGVLEFHRKGSVCVTRTCYGEFGAIEMTNREVTVA